MKIVLAVVLTSGVAHAEVGLRMPIDVTLGKAVGVGVLGFELDLGTRIGDWYLGATADYMLRLDVNDTPTEGVPLTNRLRGGVEARYTFHHGTATLGGSSGDCCCGGDPGVEVPRLDWVGARFGLQTIDEFASHQPYAELELGTTANGGNFQLGGYVAAGIEVESSQIGEYFTLGVQMAFGG